MLISVPVMGVIPEDMAQVAALPAPSADDLAEHGNARATIAGRRGQVEDNERCCLRRTQDRHWPCHCVGGNAGGLCRTHDRIRPGDLKCNNNRG
jgi:hypothetical protein